MDALGTTSCLLPGLQMKVISHEHTPIPEGTEDQELGFAGLVGARRIAHSGVLPEQTRRH